MAEFVTKGLQYLLAAVQLAPFLLANAHKLASWRLEFLITGWLNLIFFIWDVEKVLNLLCSQDLDKLELKMLTHKLTMANL